MAIIPMTNTFSICPEGVHVFRIYKVDYNEEFGKLIVHLVNAQGQTVQERFSLMRQDGSANDAACNAFSFFAKTALNDFNLEAIDPADLVDHYIKAEATHTVLPSNRDVNKTVTFVNLGSKSVANGFETTPVAKALSLGKETNESAEQPAPASAPVAGLDLNSLLNG